MSNKKVWRSVTYEACDHDRVRCSPDGIDVVEECLECDMSWRIKSTGDVVRLTGPARDRKLVDEDD